MARNPSICQLDPLASKIGSVAVHRIPTRCGSCSGNILLRIVIAGGEQPFAITCPHCNSEQHGRFYAQIDEPYTFKSDDLVLEDSDPVDGLAVMVATDMPIHSGFWGTSVDEHFKSPFIYLLEALGQEGQETAVHQLMPKIETMRRLRQTWYPPLRRASNSYSRREIAGMRRGLELLPDGNQIDWSTQNPEEIFDCAVEILYAPFENLDAFLGARIELFQTFKKARDRNVIELRSLLDDYDSGALPEHRDRVVQTGRGQMVIATPR
jgi:hypothetical protein